MDGILVYEDLMMDEEKKVELIVVEEEEVTAVSPKTSTEEIVVVAAEVWAMVTQFAQEASVRRIIVKNERMGLNLDVPLLAGVAGIALLPAYSALGLVLALATDCTILVERRVDEAPNGEEKAA